jgi:predicted GNAT superfamily acetyltransferase
MVAFLVAIPGLKEAARGYLHSHMMGVLPEYRNHGLGRALKMAQKRDALHRGIPLIEWTFDPLELKNAYLNIEKLGAIMRRYLFNNYGTTSSHLHGALPTDRLVAEWWVAEPRVNAAPIEARIAIPANISDLRTTDPPAAREIQLRASEQFTEYFRKGLAVVGFERSDTAGTYLLAPWHSQ